MHFPVTVHIANIELTLHAIMETLGMILGYRYYLYLKKQQGDTITQDNRLYIIVAAAFGAYFGARIVGSLENLPLWRTAAHPLNFFIGNKTVLGGLFGGLLAVELVKKIIGEKKASGDLFVYPLIFAMMIGRLGCFSAGIYEETYGIASSLPWAMNLGDGILRHPVTLYEICYLLLTGLFIRQLQNKYLMAPGAAFKVLMICYFFFRFFLDFIKPGWRYFFGLGTIQITSLLGLSYYSRYIFIPSLLLIKTPAKDH